MKKPFIPLRFIFPVFLSFVLNTSVFCQDSKKAKVPTDEYVCMPCGQDCDNKVYDAPGLCSHCMMKRVKKSDVIFKNIQPVELCSYIAKHPNVVLLDVRSKKEFEERSSPNYGTLKNAINIPIQELDARLAELNAYKNKEIIVYCSHSQRSSQASYVLTQGGFSNVTNMAGGLSVLKDDSFKK